MTDSYYRDILTLDLMIAAVGAPPSGSNEEAMLTQLKTLMANVKANGLLVQQNVGKAQEAFDELSTHYQDHGEFSDEMQKKLNGLRAAGRAHDKSLVDKVILLNEDGDLNGNAAGNGHRKFIKAMRQSLGTGKSGRDAKVSAVASTALAAGTSAETFCNQLRTPDPNVANKWLLASAIDALLPVAKANGLSAESIGILTALREEIMAVGGGAPGSSYWPSGYIYSSSSSSSPP